MVPSKSAVGKAPTSAIGQRRFMVLPTEEGTAMSRQVHVPSPADREPTWRAGPRTDRARQRLLEGAHEAFLAKGYGGARISDITNAAGMSRASFYVYFPSKQDAFLALGSESAAAGAVRIRLVRAIPTDWTESDLRQWV